MTEDGFDVDLEKQKKSKHTDNAMKVAVKVFREYSTKQNLHTSIEKMPVEDLNNLLKSFYFNARKRNGESYKRNSFVNLRFGIAKYLNKECGIDIIGDPTFKVAEEAYKSAFAQLKEVDDTSAEHYLPITLTDLKKLYNSFNIDTPSGLQEKVMFDILFFMCSKKGSGSGRENLRNFTKSMFEVKVNAAGMKYVCKAIEGAEIPVQRLFEIRGNSLKKFSCIRIIN